MPELIEEASGLLFDPTEPDALEHALTHIRDVDLATMGARAQRIAALYRG